jgi:hypothetical protein
MAGELQTPMQRANEAKAKILATYNREYLVKAFTLRTQEPMFGNIGKLVCPMEPQMYLPHELIRIGYEFLCDVEPQTL